MPQAPWISPLEASLEMSVRSDAYISPDDIKQLRNRGKLPKESYIHISKRITLYNREAIRATKINKREKTKIPVPLEIVVNWLWEFPETITDLETQGLTIPHKQEAQAVLSQTQANKQKNPTKRKTHAKTS